MHKAIHCGPKLLCLYPLWLLSSLYSTWLAARLTLGRWPTPMLDDPKSINLLVSGYHAATTLLFIPGVFIFGGLLVTLTLAYMIRRPDGWMKRLVELVSALLLFGCVFWALRQDPFGVFVWFMD